MITTTEGGGKVKYTPNELDFMGEDMENLENKIEELKKEIQQVKGWVRKEGTYRIVTNDLAEKDMIQFVKQIYKREGGTSATIFDFMIGLNLPPEQVNKVLRKWKKEGRTRELDE